MTADRIRFSRKVAPAHNVHRCTSGNVWSWISTRAGSCWRRDADGREASGFTRHQVDIYDSAHPVVWRCS